MCRKSAVERDEPHAFDLALRQKQPVKGIASCGSLVQRCDCMMMIDAQQTELQRKKHVRQSFDWHTKRKFAQPVFDCHFPEACGADGFFVFRGTHQPVYGRINDNFVTLLYGQKNVAIEK